MRIRSFVTVLFVLALLCGGVGAKTLLYGGDAYDGVQKEWVANTTRLWVLSSDFEGKGGKSVAYSLVPYNENNGNGLRSNESLCITFSDIDADISGYSAVTFEIVYGVCQNLAKIDLMEDGGFKLCVSCDGGTVFTETSAPLYQSVEGRAMKSGNDVSVLYRLETDDLKEYLSGGTITDMKLYPFGSRDVASGVFRLCGVRLYGYSDGFTPSVPKKEYYDNINTDELRLIARDEMYSLTSVEWTPPQDILLNFKDFSMHYKQGEKYRGLVYTGGHMMGTADEFKSYIDNDGVYRGPVTADSVVGAYCSSAVSTAWSAVTSEVHGQTVDMMRGVGKNCLIPVGDLKWVDGTDNSHDIIAANKMTAVYESYSKLKIGDSIMHTVGPRGTAHHVRMITGETVTIRNAEGVINGKLSYIVSTETSRIVDNSSWNVDKEYYFNELYDNFYLGFSNSAFTYGLVEKPYVEAKNMSTADNISQGLHGVVASNHRIVELKLEFIDTATGKTVYEKHEYENRKYYLLYYMEDVRAALTALPKGIYKLKLTLRVAPLTAADGEYNVFVPLDIKYYKGGGYERFYKTLKSFKNLLNLRTAAI